MKYGLITLNWWFFKVFLLLWFNCGATSLKKQHFIGSHTLQGSKKAIVLVLFYFIFSEVYVLFWVFLGFLSFEACPQQLKFGSIWPPSGIIATKPMWAFLYWNTVVLLYSGLTITYTHLLFAFR